VKRLGCCLALLVLASACKKEQPPAPPVADAPPPVSAEPPSARTAPAPQPPSDGPPSLSDARRGFVTRVTDRQRRGKPPPSPPGGLFELIRYPSKVGELAAYVSVRPSSVKRRPAIVWLLGGFDNGIGETAWLPAKPDNDQSVRAFREVGIVLMFPSLRGGSGNPGRREGFFGEVDDVISAADSLASLPDVDPQRIYLGGHSTGGTLALLVAETTERFRAVFAFGPAADIRSYGASFPFKVPDDLNETRVRSPMFFTASIRTPTFVFEGVDKPSNSAALPILAEGARSAPLKTFPVRGADHFSVLAPITSLLALKILSDVGPEPRFSFSDSELEARVREVLGTPD